MSSFWKDSRSSRKRKATRPNLVEALELRTTLTAGITVSPVAAITATAGTALTNIPVADFVVTDPTTPPGNQRLALVAWGDGQATKQVVPTALPDGSFEILGTHTYTAAGDYTISVTVAVPGNPSTQNTISDQVSVSGSTSPPTTNPNPNPNPNPGPTTNPVAALQATGVSAQVFLGRAFQHEVATITTSRLNVKSRQLRGMINWGDGSRTVAGKVRAAGNGQFVLLGADRYRQAGLYRVNVAITDTFQDNVQASSQFQVTSRV